MFNKILFSFKKMQSFEQFKTVNCEGFKALGPYSAGKVVSGNANTVYLSG